MPKREKASQTTKTKKVPKNAVRSGGQGQQALYCSPARHDMGQKHNTCLAINELQDLARNYNTNVVGKAMRKQRVSKGSSATLDKIKVVNDKKQLYESLKEKLAPTCGTADHNWVQQDFVDPSVRNKLLSKAFRPLKPREWYVNRQTWLNTYDIQKVMQQYEDKYKDFFFLGVFPIDFASKDEYGHCVAQDMCSFGMKEVLQKGKQRFAMVLNLDRHDQSGSHWVAFYCGLNPKKKNFGVFYYDSVANPPPREVASFMQQMEKEAYTVFSKTVADKFTMRYNKVQKQFSNYDCGVFSEVFLTQILKDIPFDDICRRMHTDTEINRLRDVLYTPSAVSKQK